MMCLVTRISCFYHPLTSFRFQLSSFHMQKIITKPHKYLTSTHSLVLYCCVASTTNRDVMCVVFSDYVQNFESSMVQVLLFSVAWPALLRMLHIMLFTEQANLKISCPLLKNSQITQIAWSKKLLAYCSEAGQGNRLTFLSILFPWYDQIQHMEFCVNWITEGWLNTVREICMRNMTFECMKN